MAKGLIIYCCRPRVGIGSVLCRGVTAILEVRDLDRCIVSMSGNRSRSLELMYRSEYLTFRHVKCIGLLYPRYFHAEWNLKYLIWAPSSNNLARFVLFNSRL